MKFLMVPYILIWGMVMIWAIDHANDIDENEYFKFNWRLLLWFGMTICIPFWAEFCGLL